ncbi:hypothetical protein LZ554_006951 [Drepanopeziza brunnea f. sp. 'monogermtubi']|nr:hypothetical protein LZ554_006951 [Drepanopeziza brunnea f. sp. 'monogermtubi']
MSDNIPTPSSIPSPPINPHSLSERINISTRPLHTQLNRLILTRLPLALPPYTNNPSTYVSGLLHIAPIYNTFEGLWATILCSPQLPTTIKGYQDACDPDKPLLDSRTTPLLSPTSTEPPILHIPRICGRTHSLLTHLRLPGLLRADRLLADLRTLANVPDNQIDVQLAAISRSGPLSQFLAHTKASVEANPHVLLAYAWVLYMALFSGGRYLRAALKDAGGHGTTFWDRDSSPIRPYSIDDSAVPPRSTSRQAHSQSESDTAPTRSEPNHNFPPRPSEPVPGLQFFNFVGGEDGEDLKREFKKRIADAENLLTAREKDDIEVEAQHIFTYMIQLIHQLDVAVGTKEEDLETSASAARGRPLSASRDSVSVAKERIGRNTIQREESEQREPGPLTEAEAEGPRKRSFLDVVGGPLARVVEFRGRILSFDAIVRRLSGPPPPPTLPQVTFMVEKNAILDDGGVVDQQDAVDVKEGGSMSLQILATLLLMVVLLGYKIVCSDG